jgi:hypothetical protein
MPGINTSGRSAAYNNTIFNPGNEPSFTTPYLYNYIGRQDLSVLQNRNIAKSYYSPTPGGLPGNSDARAMESWLLWNMLGLYPMVAQTTFLIGSPWFANTTISLEGGKSLTVTTVNGSDSSSYVQSLQVNGQPWTKPWLAWNDIFANGGTTDFVMGPNPANWATGAPPPSPTSEFTINTPPTVIAPPGKVPTSPSMAVLREEARKHRRLLRHIAVAMMTVAIVAMAAASFALWWFCLRKGTKTVDDGEAGQKPEKGNGASAKRKGFESYLGTKWAGRFTRRSKKDTSRPESKGESIGADTVAEVPGGLGTSKKYPSISVLEVRTEEPLERSTPKGTNARIKEESTV